MSDINRMLDDLLDTQPHRSDLRQNIVEAFELMKARLADERKHSDRLAVFAERYQLDLCKHRCEWRFGQHVEGCIEVRALLAAHTERAKP